MRNLNIVSIAYISFRLAPFILVCFFSLSSIFNQDLKGVMYLSGLLFTSFLAVIIGNAGRSTFERTNENVADELYKDTTRVCNLLTLTTNGPLSNLPLGQVVFSYTAGYLGYVIFKYGLISQNIPSLIIFPMLIISEIAWSLHNQCAKPFALLAAIVVGAGGGIGWAAMIDSFKLSYLQYFNGLSNKDSCTVAAKQTMKCTKREKSS
jgi:hypothetical protein